MFFLVFFQCHFLKFFKKLIFLTKKFKDVDYFVNLFFVCKDFTKIKKTKTPK